MWMLWCASALAADPDDLDLRLERRVLRDEVVIGAGAAVALVSIPVGVLVAEQSYPESRESMASTLTGVGIGATGVTLGLLAASVGAIDLAIAGRRRDTLLSVSASPSGVQLNLAR